MKVHSSTQGSRLLCRLPCGPSFISACLSFFVCAACRYEGCHGWSAPWSFVSVVSAACDQGNQSPPYPVALLWQHTVTLNLQVWLCIQCQPMCAALFDCNLFLLLRFVL